MHKWSIATGVYVFLGICALLSHKGGAEDRCNRALPPPPTGCCPPSFELLCPKNIPLCGGKTLKNVIGNVTNTITKRFSRHPCARPWQTEACETGFYLDTIVANATVKPCPSGFYCPQLAINIVPCPSGTYCVRMKKRTFKKTSGSICNTIGICCEMEGKNSVPPLYVKNTNTFICPGMGFAHPCPEGNYCPNTTAKIICKKGHYCPKGSVAPIKCPFLTKCGNGESAPLKNASGPLAAVLIVGVFVLAFYAFTYRKKIKSVVKHYYMRLTNSERPYDVSYSLKGSLKGMAISIIYATEEQKWKQVEPKSFTMDIHFDNLGLVLKSHDEKVILSGVTGTLRSGEVTAVMGPSGAGKTTFLNALSGKAYYGKVRGTVSVNGEEVTDIKKFRRITGFVPQDDVMHRVLTVKEVLTFQARLRLPSSVTRNEISRKVSQTLDLLDISHVMNSQIGDEETRGISGGQRKRVNIGMELVADPTLLFLDEPTSGLDSTSSLSVLGALRAVAEKGRLTVACVIHQPRYEIFSLFHNVLFLGPGGKTVYQGSVNGGEAYFQSLGYECPAKVNPADFYMDVIGGVYKKSNEDQVDGLFTKWNTYKKKSLEDENENTEKNAVQYERRAVPMIHQQFWTFLLREIYLQFRYMKSLFMDLALVLLAGGVLGGIYSEVELVTVIAMNTSSALAIGLTAMLSSLRCFGNHRTTFWRESASGVNTFSYFMAVNVCQLPIIVLTPMVYLSLQYNFTAPRALLKYHYGAVFGAQFACTGMGYFISCILNPRNSQMASVVFVLISSLLAGSTPSLCQLNKFTFVGPAAYSLSYCRWFVEALFEKEAARYPDVMRTQIYAIVHENNYSLDNYSFCIGVLIIFGICTRLFAYLCLIFTNRGQQQ